MIPRRESILDFKELE
ncbi:unnamed protein product, partial [Allacma fusca]